MTQMREVYLDYIARYFRGHIDAPEGIRREIMLVRGNINKPEFIDRFVISSNGVRHYLDDFIPQKLIMKTSVHYGLCFMSHLTVEYVPILQECYYDRVVYDFDSNDEATKILDIVKRSAKEIEKNVGATPFIVSSGFKGVHITFFLDRPITYNEYILVYGSLLRRMPEELRKYEDRNMLQYNRVARVPLTYNVKDEVRLSYSIYPEGIRWHNFVFDIFTKLKVDKIEVIPHISQIPQRRLMGGDVPGWLMKVVNRGLPDGRKRFLFMCLIPRFANNEQKAVELAHQFFENSCKNYSNCGKVYDSWIRSVIRSSRSKGFKGFGLNKLAEKDPELYSIIMDALDK